MDTRSCVWRGSVLIALKVAQPSGKEGQSGWQQWNSSESGRSFGFGVSCLPKHAPLGWYQVSFLCHLFLALLVSSSLSFWIPYQRRSRSAFLCSGWVAGSLITLWQRCGMSLSSGWCACLFAWTWWSGAACSTKTSYPSRTSSSR